MKDMMTEFGYGMRMIGWAFVLHVRRWSRYRMDVLLWVGSIWLTILAQGLFVFSAYDATGGQFFGYTFSDVVSFFGLTLLSTGLAQIVVHGFTLRLANAVWRGDFDFWIVQPVPFLIRVLQEDVGLVWFWPHTVVGAALLAYALPAHLWLTAVVASTAAAAVEVGIIVSICMPAIKWGRWNPDEGLWEYLERSRSIPVGRSSSKLLLAVSFGVLQYSIALEVLTGRISLMWLVLMAACSLSLAWLLSAYFVRTYTSASS
jgi:ABC-type uncharacterized transport system permease subunit